MPRPLRDRSEGDWLMACRPEMLSAYIDGQLEPAARRRVEAHVRRCLRCRAELDELVALKRLLEAAPVPSPPAGLTESIVGRVRFREARRQRFRHRWRFWQGAAAGAAVAGLALAGWLLSHGDPRLNPSPPEPAAGGALEAVVLEHSRHALLMETGSGDWIDLYVETAGGPR